MEQSKSLTTNSERTPSLKQGVSLSKQEDKWSLVSSISDMLLKIAKLFQMKDFDAESSVLLAEWILNEYKHTDYAVIHEALSRPPMMASKERTWRLTPEVLAEWIDVTRTKMIAQLEKEESTKRQTEKVEFPELSPKVDELLNEVKSQLLVPKKDISDIHSIETKRPKEKSYAVGYPHTPPTELKKRELHLQWISENIHPHTKMKLEGFKEENEWLLSKGYVLENGNLKEI